MRSLAAQLVVLALAVPVSTVPSSHPHTRTSLVHFPKRVVPPPSITCAAVVRLIARCARCAARCRACTAVRSRSRVAQPSPCPHRRASAGGATSLRVQLTHQARVLGRYRAQARRPLRVRMARFQAWVCIHQHEAAWNDTGDPYWGGLQMDRGFMRAYGPDMIARHHGGLADTWTPAEQIVVAERAYYTRGFAPWPQTARSCGVR